MFSAGTIALVFSLSYIGSGNHVSVLSNLENTLRDVSSNPDMDIAKAVLLEILFAGNSSFIIAMSKSNLVTCNNSDRRIASACDSAVRKSTCEHFFRSGGSFRILRVICETTSLFYICSNLKLFASRLNDLISLNKAYSFDF